MFKSFFLFFILILTFFRFCQPIFIDEIIYLMTTGRFVVEGYKLWNLLSQCYNSTTIEVPYLFWPAFIARSYWYKFCVNNLRLLDFFSIAKISFIILFFYQAILKTTVLPKFYRLSFLFLLFIGNNTYFLLMNRPESSLMLCLLLVLFLSFYQVDNPYKFLFSIAYIFIFYFQSSLHPQVVLFLPFFLYLIYIQKNYFFLKSISFIILAIISFYAFKLWAFYYSCESVAHTDNFLKSYSLSFTNFLSNPKGEILKIFNNFYDLFRLPYSLIFREKWEGGLISYSRTTVGLEFLTICNIFILISSFGLYLYLFFFLPKIRKSFFKQNEKVIILVFCILLWSISRGKFEYVTPLPWMILVLYLAATISYLYNSDLLNLKILKLYIWSIYLAFILTLLFISYNTVGFSLKNLQASPHNNLAIYRTPYMLDKSLRSNLPCGVENLSVSDKLVLDEATVFLYPFRPNVILAIGGITGNVPNNIFDPDSLTKLDASAFLVSCSRSYQLRSFSEYVKDDLCCARLR